MELKQRDKKELAKKAMLELLKWQYPVPYLLYKGAEKLLPFLDKQGEIKKADEKFVTNIIKTAKENGVDEFTLKFDKSQLTGLDTTIKKVKRNAGFDLDIGIKAGLAKGVYERVGGVIRNTVNKEVVFWLKEGGSITTKAQKITLTLSSLGKATIAFSDFLYMHDNFKKIKELLNNINQKLDAQNLSKIQTGFILAKEAESMSDINSANVQIINSRHSLEEGSHIFKNLFENIKKEDEQYSLKSFTALKLVIVSQLGIARTYLWNNEYLLTRQRLLALKAMVLHESINYIKRRCELDDSHWFWYVVLFTVGLPIAIPTAIYGLFGGLDTNEDKALKEIKELNKANENSEKIVRKIIRRIKRRKIELPEEVKALLNFNEFIDGYLLEIEKLNESRMPLRDMLKELPVYQEN